MLKQLVEEVVVVLVYSGVGSIAIHILNWSLITNEFTVLWRPGAKLIMSVME